MSNIKITPLTSGRIIGEGPHWLPKDKSLLYVDIINGDLFRYYTETGREQKLHVENSAGTGDFASFIVPFEGREDEFAVGVGRTLASFKWSPSDPDDTKKKSTPLVFVDSEDSGTRLNDGKCDPRGRLWAGTMCIEEKPGVFPPEKGSLYRFDSDLKASNKATKITISNGLAWNSDRSTFYYIDTLNYTVDAFDYDDATGDIENRRVVLDYKAHGIKGLPDGMAIDENNNLWVACFGGWQIICIDPKVGKVIRTLPLPSCNITSCCWGGLDYSTLYVTSGTLHRSAEELKSHPDSGKTFAVTGLGVKGTPSINYKADLKILDEITNK